MTTNLVVLESISALNKRDLKKEGLICFQLFLDNMSNYVSYSEKKKWLCNNLFVWAEVI